MKRRADTFRATADWAVGQGIATATFHILTPYPGTALYERYRPRMRVHDWRSKTTPATSSLNTRR